MNKQQNTQQPVAWEYFDGTWRIGVDGERENYEMFGYPTRDLYTYPPAPRDVLMAAMRDAVSDMKAGAFLADCGTDIAFRAVDYASIADRYASQVQPERNTVTLEEMVAKLKAGENGDAISEAMTQTTADMALGRAIREGRASQSEPVAWRVFRSATEYELFTSEYNAKQRAKQLGSAAVQPLYHSPPAVALLDVLEQLQLAETEVINAKTWSAGEEAKTHCKHALTAIAVARSLLSAVQKH